MWLKRGVEDCRTRSVYCGPLWVSVLGITEMFFVCHGGIIFLLGWRNNELKIKRSLGEKLELVEIRTKETPYRVNDLSDYEN